ncbi:MAG: hypothetical protein ACRECW_11185, partial [Phyllobacterium sp.]
SSNPGKGVSPSLLASPPAMILNHKTALQGIPKRFHVTLTDSSVVSIDAPVIHDLRIMEIHRFRHQSKAQL